MSEDQKVKYDIEKIRAYLEANPWYFNIQNQVSTIDDVIHFKMRNPKNVIFVGEDFLCDIYSCEIWIVRLLDKAKFDGRREQKLKIEAIELVVPDCYHKFPRFNGYWRIPNDDDYMRGEVDDVLIKHLGGEKK